MKARIIFSSLFLFMLLTIPLASYSQPGDCTSGDCYDKVGTFNFPDDERYEGEWQDGKPHGVGTWSFPDGSKYTGHLKDGKYNGVGTFFWPDDVKYEGEWKDGRKNGVGTMTFPDGSKFVGKFTDGKQDEGNWTFPDGGTRSSNKVGSFKIR